MNQQVAAPKKRTTRSSAILLPADYYASLSKDLPPVGMEVNGGRFIGILHCEGHVYGLVVASVAEGEITGKWGRSGKEIAATSVNDGLANTLAMAVAGSAIASKVVELTIGGVKDWHIPARDELEILYRACKPTADKNWFYRSGDNPSSLPPGVRYLPDFPLQTTLDGFKPGEPFAFEPAWYWSSTQYSADIAFCQDFDDGDQYGNDKDGTLRVRAVRRFLIH